MSYKSHPSRVRGLKSSEREIEDDIDHSRTPRGCVD